MKLALSGVFCYGNPILSGEAVMSEQDRIYFARRAAEEEKLALSATDPEAAEAHRKMQRVYAERASMGDRPMQHSEIIG
jgi:hypothetical protein